MNRFYCFLENNIFNLTSLFTQKQSNQLMPTLFGNGYVVCVHDLGA